MKKGLKYVLLLLLVTSLMVNLCGCFLLEDDDYYYDDYDDYDDDEGFLEGLFDLFSDDDDWDDWDDDDWDDWHSGNNGYGNRGWGRDDDWDDDDWDDWDDDDDYYDNHYGNRFGNRYSNDDDYYDDDDYDDYSYYGGSLPGNTDYSQYTFGGRLGSAKELEGTTLVVSVFLDDQKTSWNFNSSADVTSRSHALTYMKIATDWISQQCRNYGVTTKFIYDWEQNPDLYYTGRVSCDMTDEESEDPYYDQMDWIDRNVDSQALMDKYGADDIIYMLYINTPMSNECVSATYNYAEDDYYPYEVVSIYVHSWDEEESPASYAHEILHTYGAPDLYTADTDGQNYGVTQKFVSHMESTRSNDIMFTTYDCYTDEPYYDRITNEFSEMDAYYVGLTDDDTEARAWGFEPSQH